MREKNDVFLCYLMLETKKETILYVLCSSSCHFDVNESLLTQEQKSQTGVK